MTKVYDMLDQEITEGSYVVYGRRQNNYSLLEVYKILKITEYEKRWPGEIENYNFEAVGVSKEWNQHLRLKRKSVISSPSHMVVIKEDILPERYKEIFRRYENENM